MAVKKTKTKTWKNIPKPSGLSRISKKASGVSMGQDKNGVFVYTHRARSKSYKKWENIPKSAIDFVESTG